jgi:hypothetical protein
VLSDTNYFGSWFALGVPNGFRRYEMGFAHRNGYLLENGISFLDLEGRIKHLQPEHICRIADVEVPPGIRVWTKTVDHPSEPSDHHCMFSSQNALAVMSSERCMLIVFLGRRDGERLIWTMYAFKSAYPCPVPEDFFWALCKKV